MKMYRWETFVPVGTGQKCWNRPSEPSRGQGARRLRRATGRTARSEPPGRGRPSPPRVHGEGRMMRIDTVLRQRALITILTLIVIHGCGSGGSSDPSRNGAITMQVRWQSEPLAVSSAATDAGCVDAEPVDTAGFRCTRSAGRSDHPDRLRHGGQPVAVSPSPEPIRRWSPSGAWFSPAYRRTAT